MTNLLTLLILIVYTGEAIICQTLKATLNDMLKCGEDSSLYIYKTGPVTVVDIYSVSYTHL